MGADLLGVMKPSFDEVFAYATKSADHFIRKLAGQLAPEIKEEISQEALMRAWTAYEKLDAARGWKSFVQMHCRGSVLDYIKAGKSGVASELGSHCVELTMDMDDSESASFESTMGYFGINSQTGIDKAPFTPNWALLSRMCAVDDNLHIVAKMLMGFTQRQIAEHMTSTAGVTISRERVSQRLYEFFDKFDNPEYFGDPWTEQSIYALGLCSHYHMKEVDNQVGWELMPVELKGPESFRDGWKRYGLASKESILELFDWANGQVAKKAFQRGDEVDQGEYVCVNPVPKVPKPKHVTRPGGSAEQLTQLAFEFMDPEPIGQADNQKNHLSANSI